MSDQQVSFFSTGPPETVLEPEPQEAVEALASASGVMQVGEVCKRWPTCLEAWASLGEVIEASESASALAYAAFRTGYHRGLDRLRGSGWRGSGYVRWAHPTNRGFLRCLAGLQRVAQSIGEASEARRCHLFLRQLDPDWPPADASS